jgi:hypothetical protein
MKKAILSKYQGECVVTLFQSVKRGGELNAVYRLDYSSLEHALSEIESDLRAGRVEKITVGGRQLDDKEIALLGG